MRDIHEANRKYWDASTPEWQKLDEGDWRKCPRQPEIAFEGNTLETIQEFVGNISGKRICVIGSGDNYAAFALAGLGAEVTSTDISKERLKVAEQRAKTLGLKIQFIRDDAAELSHVPSAKYDLVCSTNGFFVWIADLSRVFKAVNRVLKPGGYYIFYDIHPFQRPWKEQTAIEMEKSYFATGPFKDKASNQKIYNYHWTLSDIVNALINNSLVIRRIEETQARDSRFWTGFSYGHGTDKSLLDWHKNPRAGLPAWLTVAVQKL
jgi:ubiquinone/menaquinone biosynthesis C-methylase UbiE